jgi:hypothetical protein
MHFYIISLKIIQNNITFFYRTLVSDTNPQDNQLKKFEKVSTGRFLNQKRGDLLKFPDSAILETDILWSNLRLVGGLSGFLVSYPNPHFTIILICNTGLSKIIANFYLI